MNDNEVNRLFLAAAASIAVHQGQSAVVEPGERAVRALALLGLVAVTAAFRRSPRRARGGLAVAVGAGPVFGAVVGHLAPLVRDGRVEPASETAALNLGGGTILLALGAALLRRPADPSG